MKLKNVRVLQFSEEFDFFDERLKNVLLPDSTQQLLDSYSLSSKLAFVDLSISTSSYHFPEFNIGCRNFPWCLLSLWVLLGKSLERSSDK